MLKFIDNHNLREQMLTGSPNKPHCVAAAHTCLIESDHTKWHQQLMHNGNAANGNKLQTY